MALEVRKLEMEVWARENELKITHCEETAHIVSTETSDVVYNPTENFGYVDSSGNFVLLPNQAVQSQSLNSDG